MKKEVVKNVYRVWAIETVIMPTKPLRFINLSHTLSRVGDEL